MGRVSFHFQLGILSLKNIMSKCNVCLSEKQLSQLICGRIRLMWETIIFILTITVLQLENYYSFQKTSARDEREHFPTLPGLREKHQSLARGEPLPPKACLTPETLRRENPRQSKVTVQSSRLKFANTSSNPSR